jgi:type II secretory pathway predicted ATPase ExeA
MLASGRDGKGWSSTVVSQVLNGEFPAAKGVFIEDAVKVCVLNERIRSWVKRNGLEVEALMRKDTVRKTKKAPVKKETVKRSTKPETAKPEDEETKKAVRREMLKLYTREYFKLNTGDPFSNEVRDARDIFISSSHSFLLEVMLDAAKYAGFIAISGAVGSGKSMIKKAAKDELKKLGIGVIEPLILDKSKVSDSTLLEAIMHDLGNGKMKRSKESQSRQVNELLSNRSEKGTRQVMIVDEAHLLPISTLKMLKQIYEMEQKFRKMLGIIIIGQEELATTLDEVRYTNLREVIQRISLIKIEGLGKDLKPYLELKFQRVGRKLSEFIDDEALEAMSERMSEQEGRRVVSTAYPLAVNNMMIQAMNLTAEIGDERITVETINEV